MTRGALQANLFALLRVPIAVDAAVRPILPIPVHGAMTPGAQFLRLIPGNLLPEIVNKRLPIDWVVAIEAPRVNAVLKLKPRVLCKLAAGRARRRIDAVKFTASIRESADLVGGAQGNVPDWHRVRGPRGDRRRDRSRTLEP